MSGSRVAVHLDRRGFLLGVPPAAVSAFVLATASSLRVEVVGWLGVACSLLIVVRFLDPRPEVTFDDDGATFGGLAKSAPLRDAYVPWTDVDTIGKPDTPVTELMFTRRTPFVPPSQTRLMQRMIPREFPVRTQAGRSYKVYSPGRGLTLEGVHADMTERWHRARPHERR